MKNITFFRTERRGEVKGSLVEFDIYVDGIEFAVVRQGETKTVQVEDGVHRIQAKTRQGASTNFVASMSAGYAGSSVQELKSDVVLVGEEEDNVSFMLSFGRQGEPLMHRASIPSQQGSGNQTVATDDVTQYYQNTTAVNSKSHMVAGLLAIFLGALGIHKFYLGYKASGMIMLLLTIFGSVLTVGVAGVIIGIIAIIEGIIYLTKNQSDFERIYILNKRSWF